MLTRPIIRPATDGDVAGITEIYADVVLNTTATYEIVPPSHDEMLRRLAAVTSAGYPYFVVVDPSPSPEMTHTVLGYAYVSPYRPRPAYRFTVEHSVYVSRDARDRGIGRLLMEAIISECETMGFRQIIAVIGESGPDNLSIRFHEKFGFQHSGKLKGSGYKFGRWLDTTFMQLSISGGAQVPADPESIPEIQFQRQLKEQSETSRRLDKAPKATP
ncbi:N-acetyltransferase family protein [Echria macrotheca]|uniref:N-acetyltransferase family protein n=1 Tax=Echria macrotheca TaxID=438768 RepID=A0AAJ0B9P0_9PEZI|nr:N-acetyltransferase family protein [Echria macrotheca]